MKRYQYYAERLLSQGISDPHLDAEQLAEEYEGLLKTVEDNQ